MKLIIDGELSGSKNLHLTKGTISGAGVFNVMDLYIENSGVSK